MVVPHRVTRCHARAGVSSLPHRYSWLQCVAGIATAAGLLASTMADAAPWMGANFTAHQVGASPRAVVVADLDGDGTADLACANYDASSVTVLFGEGGGRFGSRLDLATGDGPRALLAEDLDVDGRRDLVTANAGASTLSILRGLGGRGFAAHSDLVVGGACYGVAAGDLNGDGRRDLVAVNNDANMIAVFLALAGGGYGAATAHPTAEGPTSVAIGEFTGDGLADVIVTASAASAISVLAGSGGGALAAHVELATPAGPAALASGDVNRDGRADLVVACQSASKLAVFRGSAGGLGARTDHACAAQPYAAAIADLDGDGDPEIVGAAYAEDALTVLTNTNGSFGGRRDYRSGPAPAGIAVGNLDEDQNADVAVACSGSGLVTVLAGNGDRTLGSARTMSVGTAPRSVAVADFDGAGGLDFFVLNSVSGTVTPYAGSGEGGFVAGTSVSVGTGAVQILAADFSRDGRADFAVLQRNSSGVYLWTAIGAGAFGYFQSLATGAMPVAMAMSDLDLDGRLDVAVANATSNDLTLYFGQSGGSFGARTDLPLGFSPSTVAIADADADGRPDLVVCSASGDRVAMLRGLIPGFAAPTTLADVTDATGLAVADLDRNGLVDLVVTRPSVNAVTTLMRTGAGTYTRADLATPPGPGAVLAEDLDGDGLPELLVTCTSAGAVAIFTGLPGGAYSTGSRALLGAGLQPVALAVGDTDGDGRPEAFVANMASDDVTVLPNFSARASAPVLVSPADLAHVASIPTFAWRSIPDALTYRVIVARSSDLSLTKWVWDLPGGTVSTPYGGDILEPGQSFWWTVKALVGGQWTPTARPWRFYRPPGTATVGVPSLYAPADGASVGLPELFTWASVSGATSYRLWIADDPAFTQIRWRSLPISATSWQVTSSCGSLTVGQTYYWGVTAVDAAGNEGGRSAFRSFVVTSLVDPPAAPLLTYPPQGAVLTSRSVPYSWQAVAGATSYELTYSTSSSFAPGANTTWTVTGITGTTHDVSLSSGSATIYWKVRARNSAGPGPESSLRSFTFQFTDGPITRMTLLRPTGTVHVARGAALSARALVVGRYIGTISGWWVRDNANWQSFSAPMTAASGAQFDSPLLPTDVLGSHTIYCRTDAPTSRYSDVATYVVENRVEGAPARLVMSAAATKLVAGSAATSLLTLMVLDAAGTLVTTESGRAISLSATGPAAVSPTSGTTTSGIWNTTVQAGETPGIVTLTATSPGLQSATLTIEVLANDLDALKADARAALDELQNLVFGSGVLLHPVMPGYQLASAYAFVDGASLADTAGLARLALASRAIARIYFYDPLLCTTACSGYELPGAMTLLDDGLASVQGILALELGLLTSTGKLVDAGSAVWRTLVKQVKKELDALVITLVNDAIQAMLDGFSDAPAWFKRSLSDALDLFAAGLKDALNSTGAPLEVLTTSVMRYPVGAWLAGHLYVRGQTQADFDRALARAQQPASVSAGAAAAATASTLVSAAAVSQGAHEIASDALEGADMASTIASITNVLIGIGGFWSVIFALPALFAGFAYGWAFGAAMSGYQQMPEHVSRAVDAAFGADAPIVRVSPIERLEGLGYTFAEPTHSVWTRLMESQSEGSDDLVAAAQDLVEALGRGDTLALQQQLPGYLQQTADLNRRARLATTPVTAAAGAARVTLPDFATSADSLWSTNRRASIARLQFAAGIGQYLEDPSDPVARQRALDAGMYAVAQTNAARGVLTQTVSPLFTTPAVPVLRVTHLVLPDSVQVDQPFEVTATVANLGAGTATGSYALLRPDTTMAATGADSIALPALAAGDTSLVSWVVVPASRDQSDGVKTWLGMLSILTACENGSPVTEGVAIGIHVDRTLDAHEEARGLVRDKLVIGPNPVRGTLSIRFTLAEAGPVHIELFDLLGRRRAEIAAGYFAAGMHALPWNALTGDGVSLPPGMYMVRLTDSHGTRSTRFVFAP